MFNLHLLKSNMTVTGYEVVCKHKQHSRYEFYVQELPEYPIALCPFCYAENIEKVDTYSPDGWDRMRPEGSLHGENGIVYHCEHFVMVEPFLYVPAPDSRAARSTLWGDVFPFVNLAVPERIDEVIWSTQSQSPPFFRERQPTVVGFALEQGLAKTVIHALPVCEPTKYEFRPKYTLFIISYYSQKPAEAYSAIEDEALNRSELITNTLLVLPNLQEKHWFNLAQWVEQDLLYWLDVSKNGELSLQTHDVDDFPYKYLERLVTK